MSIMIGKVLAYYRGDMCGPVLEKSGCFKHEDNFSDISDQNMPVPRETGLMLFQGYVEVESGDDPDVSYIGEWRRLTHWEMLRVLHGMLPWDKEEE